MPSATPRLNRRKDIKIVWYRADEPFSISEIVRQVLLSKLTRWYVVDEDLKIAYPLVLQMT